jgi:hypothetical protein
MVSERRLPTSPARSELHREPPLLAREQMTTAAPSLPRFTTSWDDGHPADLRLAEMLAKYRWPATFYIPRCAERGRLSDTAVRELASAFEVGAHTLSHCDLTRVSVDQAAREITESKDWIEQVTGKPCDMFCFPMGRFRTNQLSLVKQAGYAGARTVELMSLAPPRSKKGVLLMPTTVQAFPHSPVSYLKNISKRLAGHNLWNYLRYGSRGDWSTAARSLFSVAAHRHGIFHLWGHSWEIEEQGGWKALEEVFQYLSPYAAKASGVTNGEICAAVNRPS